MSLNVIDLIKSQFDPTLISQISTHLGESESGISKAISALLPVLISGLANKADKPEILDSILGATSGDLLENLKGNSQNSMISTILTSIFGDKSGTIVNAISSFSGINNGSSDSLLNMVTGATVGSLGKYATENNLGTSGLSNLLTDQKRIVSSSLPAGLSLASLGLGNWGNTETIVPELKNVNVTSFDEPKVNVTRAGDTHVNIEPDNNNSEGSIWKWLIPLLLLFLAGWFLWNQIKKTNNVIVTTADTATVKTDSANTTLIKDSIVKVDTNIDLNGKILKGYAGGMEDSMISFLKSDAYKNAENDAALKNKWYNFDHVNFKIGSATDLEDGSQGQLENLVAILKAFPDAKVKIGAYTDKTGTEATNKKISKDRAEFIKSWLTKNGVGTQVLSADGYGSEFATVPATASNEERAVDRKMAVRFAK